MAHYYTGNWEEAIQALAKAKVVRKRGYSLDYFILAMAHWKLGHKEEARTQFAAGAEWMDKNNPDMEELRRLRAEGAELLGITESQSPTDSQRAGGPTTEHQQPDTLRSTKTLNAEP